jgi:3-deoxy-7-phosphoheptulonate synthase
MTPTLFSDTETDDVRIEHAQDLPSPATLLAELPLTPTAKATVVAARRAIHDVLRGADDRLIVVVGPCSIHDPAAALVYAAKLKAEADVLARELIVVMRVYFEKPRTTVGWKGLINDPRLDESFDIPAGLRAARSILLRVNGLGLPAATEFLDLISPQYIADLVAWGAIGARTTESPSHRQLASGLSCPIGFKNGTDGNVQIAVDAIKAAAARHHFIGISKTGQVAVLRTVGNEDCHLILRGGKTPNYSDDAVQAVCAELAKADLRQQLMIDASHANSGKIAARQTEVIDAIARRIAAADTRVSGVMLESNLVEGRQDIKPGEPLRYGQSVTDACLGWEATVPLLHQLAAAVRARRGVEVQHLVAT